MDEVKIPSERAIEFAQCLTESDYHSADRMLHPSLKEDWTVESLRASYNLMLTSSGEAIATVVKTSVSVARLDHGTFVFVPIQTAEEVEGVSVVVDSSGLICELEFGRP